MVASSSYLPGSGQDPLLARVVALEKALANSTRRNVNQASITDPLTGAVLFGADPDAGYGMALPNNPLPMYPATPGVVLSSSGSPVPAEIGQMSVINPAYVVSYQISVQSGGVTNCTAQGWVTITEPITGYSFTFPVIVGTNTVAGVATPTLVNQASVATILPQSVLGKELSATLFIQVTTPGSSNAVAGVISRSNGCSYVYAKAHGA